MKEKQMGIAKLERRLAWNGKQSQPSQQLLMMATQVAYRVAKQKTRQHVAKLAKQIYTEVCKDV